MFLDKTILQNKKLIDFSISSHQQGNISPDSYVIDLDTLYSNAKMMIKEAKKENIELFFMLKQIGRNPIIAKELIEIGFSGAVVVDFKEALVMIENDIKIGNVGHLVQIPKHLLKKIILAKPLYITAFSGEILEEINNICNEFNITQDIMLKTIDLENDNIYEGQYGGFELSTLEERCECLKQYKNLNICGLTAFPCILLDEKTNTFNKTNNTDTILKAQKILNSNGFDISILNMPSASASYSFGLLSSLNATHAEPGHALTGTTPYHLKIDDKEQIAMVYLTEVSHYLAGKSYCYGGGYYRRGNLLNAFVNNEKVNVFCPSNESIDYYFGLDGKFNYGESVVMNFRTQVFVTRSNVVLIKGLKSDNPYIKGVYDSQGKSI